MNEPNVPVGDSGYLLDNRALETEHRFDSLAALFNPVTFRHLEMLGISKGWHCWEVGVGGPSIQRTAVFLPFFFAVTRSGSARYCFAFA